jgi:uncharacterized protein YprB with RNaseH-like and TPR domain
LKIAYFDLETWDLSPEFGPILCASVLSLPSGEMTTFRQDYYWRRAGDKKAEDMQDDRSLCVDLRDFLESHHITCGYFSKGFDLAHLRTRLVHHGERPLKRQLHFDPIWGFKGWRGIKPRSSKMKHVTNFLGLEAKPDVPAEVWLKARLGNRAAIDIVAERCEADVRITQQISEKCLELGLLKNISEY